MRVKGNFCTSSASNNYFSLFKEIRDKYSANVGTTILNYTKNLHFI